MASVRTGPQQVQAIDPLNNSGSIAIRVALAAGLSLIPQLFAQAQFFVSPGGAGLMDGSSWAHATTMDRIDGGITSPTAGAEIRIRQGTYLMPPEIRAEPNQTWTGGYPGIRIT